MNTLNKLAFAIINYTDFIRVGRILKIMQESDKWDGSKIMENRVDKLKSLFATASLNVPYWSKLISKKNNPLPDIFDKFESLPILTKEIIRQQGDKMWSKEVDKYVVATTGGTTGHPLTIRRDYTCQSINKAALWRARISWGVLPSQRTLYLNSFGKGTFLGRLRMKLANKRLGEAFPSSNEDVDVISEQIVKFKPKSVEGFATGLLETAHRTNSKRNHKIPVVVSTGEMLYPHQRKLLEAYFSGRVFTYYGSNEIGSIAFECKKQQLHICEEHVIVETVDDQGNSIINKPGRVLVTDLDNVAMPFIRYELGDIAMITDKPCECGRSAKVISELIGRNQDFLSGIGGQKLQATQLAAYLKDLKSTGQLQFVQDDFDNILIYYDGNEKEASDDIEMIKTHLIDRLGQGIKIHLKNVEVIKKTNRGKQPLVIR